MSGGSRAAPVWSQPLPGSLRLFSAGAVSVYVHKSSAAAAGLLGFNALILHAPMAPWLVLGYALIIGLHEAAHAVAAQARGLRVHFIQFAAFGGHCVMEMPRSAREAVIVFSAGLLAQAVLFAAALVHLQVSRGSFGAIGQGLFAAFVFANALLFVLNVIPRTGRGGLDTDGRVLWHVVRDRWQGRTYVGAGFAGMRKQDQASLFPPETSLLAMPAFVPAGFQQGLEVLNDPVTPVVFVVDVFVRYLGWSAETALATAVDIHNRGGILIPLADAEEARRIAAVIASDAAQAGHGFVCRAVEVALPGLTSAPPAIGSPAPPTR